MEKPPIAIVTGAARRLGKAFAFSLSRRGYAILLQYNKSQSEADEVLAEIAEQGGQAYLFRADLSDVEQIKTLYAYLDELPCQLSVLVNSASEMQKGHARDFKTEDWDAAFALNLRAPFLMAQQAARRMTQGLIVNITDVGARKAWSGFPAYTVSKAGLESLTRVLARSFAPEIRVNAIAPGLVLPSEDMPAEQWQQLVSKIPLRRSASLQEITSALDFLLDNAYVTGETISVDGGYALL